MDGLNSDILSGIAIIISILGTIVSLLYTNQSVRLTRRQFEADFHPHLSLQVLERDWGKSGLKTCLSFKLRNQSSDRTATNVRLQASLSHPTQHWRLLTTRWYQFFEKGGLEIPPEKEKETLPYTHGQHAEGLENFLLKSFPWLVYPENDPDTPEEVAFKKPVSFLLHVNVTFQPPITRAEHIKQDFYYRLTPKFRKNNSNPYCLNFWEIEFLKAS